MWDPYSVGSLLCRDPVLGDPAVWVLFCSRILFWEALLYRDPASGGPCYVWVPCAGGSWHAETLLLGEFCVGPYSVKPCYIDTLFRGTLVYRKSAVWGLCCVGILP